VVRFRFTIHEATGEKGRESQDKPSRAGDQIGSCVSFRAGSRVRVSSVGYVFFFFFFGTVGAYPVWHAQDHHNHSQPINQSSPFFDAVELPSTKKRLRDSASRAPGIWPFTCPDPFRRVSIFRFNIYCNQSSRFRPSHRVLRPGPFLPWSVAQVPLILLPPYYLRHQRYPVLTGRIQKCTSSTRRSATQYGCGKTSALAFLEWEQQACSRFGRARGRNDGANAIPSSSPTRCPSVPASTEPRYSAGARATTGRPPCFPVDPQRRDTGVFGANPK